MWTLENPPIPAYNKPLEVKRASVELGNSVYEKTGDIHASIRAVLGSIEAAMQEITIKKSDDELQIVWGEVYIPNIPDSQGDFMTVEDIRELAYDFMRSGNQAMIDLNHDNRVDYGCCMIESFIAREDDPVFIPGSWVAGVHIPDIGMWNLVKEGALNGFSMQVIAQRQKSTVKINIPQYIVGATEKAGGHHHKFIVEFDEDGRLLGGYTDEVDGHWHNIRGGTVTDIEDNHSHRFSFIEEMIFVDG